MELSNLASKNVPKMFNLRIVWVIIKRRDHKWQLEKMMDRAVQRDFVLQEAETGRV
jgi:hypothetical protein